MPLGNFLKLDRYQKKTVELEQIVSEIITDQSYTKRHHKFLFVEIQWLGLLVTAECLGSILWRLKVTITNQSTRLR